MGQAEVLEFFKGKKGWYTSRQIAQELNQSPNLVSHSLSKLVKQREITKKQLKPVDLNDGTHHLEIYYKKV